MIPKAQIYQHYSEKDNGKSPRGVDRITIAISDDMVMKIPRYSDADQSWAEIDFYNSCPSQFKHFLCPIHDVQKIIINGYMTPIIFMERVVPLDYIISNLSSKTINETPFFKILEMVGLYISPEFKIDYYNFLTYSGIDDIEDRYDNWGLTKDGRIVCIDYGLLM